MININGPLILLIHYVIIPVSVLALIRIVTGKVFAPGFINVFILFHFVLIHLRALDVVGQGFGGWPYLSVVWATPYLSLVGVSIIYFMSGEGRAGNQSYRSRIQVSRDDVEFSSVLPFASAAALGLPIVYVLDKGLSDIALFFVLENQGSSVDTLVMRVSGMSSNIHQAFTYIYSYTYLLFYPLYVSILAAFVVRRQISKTHFTLVLLSASFFSVLTSEKAGLAFVICASVFGALFAITPKQLTRKRSVQLGIAVIGAIALPGLLYPLILGFSGTSEFAELVFGNLWRRITFVPSFTSAVYFEVFPDVIPHAGFDSNRFLSVLFGSDEYMPVASMVHRVYFRGWLDGGLVNTSSVVSLYADWGMWGSLLGALSIGIILGYLEVIFNRQSILLSAGFRGAALTSCIHLLITNIYSVSLGRGLVSIPIFFFVTMFLIRTLRAQHYPALRNAQGHRIAK